MVKDLIRNKSRSTDPNNFTPPRPLDMTKVITNLVTGGIIAGISMYVASRVTANDLSHYSNKLNSLASLHAEDINEIRQNRKHYDVSSTKVQVIESRLNDHIHEFDEFKKESREFQKEQRLYNNENRQMTLKLLNKLNDLGKGSSKGYE